MTQQETDPHATDPHATASHGATEPRGLRQLPGSRLAQGRFGRMFPRLRALHLDDGRLAEIAAAMAETAPRDADGDNDRIPAGYSYLGQFIDHDLTFDPVSSLIKNSDPDALTDFRTPRFDLDNVYGRGPRDQPYLYDTGGRMLVDRHDDELDLPRNSRDVALIGDPRNDENVFVSQIQLTMLEFHNAVLGRLAEFPGAVKAGEDAFTATQRIVRWHYQWMVVHDFLRRIVGETTLRDVLRREPLVPGGEPVEQVRPRFFRWMNEAFMPVEFSVAAYRFGHSMIRAGYKLNTFVPARPIFTSTPAREDPLGHFGGFRKLPPFWQVEWARFFPLPGADPAVLQPARRIDTQLAPPLLDMPPEQVASGSRNLALRNLTRGVRLGLPSGEDVARAMGVPVLSAVDLGLPAAGGTPLWFYLLRESRVRADGKHLGPTGGRIVAEVFLGLLAADPGSYLRAEPGWRPFLPAATAGDFTMPDLIAFSGFGLTPVTGPASASGPVPVTGPASASGPALVTEPAFVSGPAS
ncbi:peroxidase family protein [Catenuloplanes japonicus]|uniref:peroxidase family protein n=1 Tax=Catenuloplanes japonicus TaxID=33876 RepID=UPI00068CC110|nr:heme peroxidase family protein [Catenuloplanes japonicus]